MKAVRLSTLRTGRLYPHPRAMRHPWYHFCYRLTLRTKQEDVISSKTVTYMAMAMQLQISRPMRSVKWQELQFADRYSI